MLQIKASLFSHKLWTKVNAICITTNGVIRSDGLAVMGAGVAKAARDYFTGIDKNLANNLINNGNHVSKIFQVKLLSGQKNSTRSLSVLSFPTKQHWKDNSTLELIKQSAQELVNLTDKEGWERVALPRPGCRNGKLSWKDVAPVLNELFDDRFIVVTL